MINTRFMDRLFSATEENDEELTEQVANDIEDARANGSVDTDEVTYENVGDGRVAITDKENGEVTMAEQAADGNYELYPAEVSEQIEGYIHPEMDGVTPGNQQGAADEHFEYHMDGQSVISPNLPDGGLNMEAGHERRIEDMVNCEGGDCEKEFSVYSDNVVVQKIFNDQEFCERVFSEVIESEETAKVGDLKVEKIDDDTVVVTSEATGDQAKVTLDGDELEVTELDSKNFSDEEEYEEGGEQYDALHVVGVDAANHVIVDAPEYDVESAQELVERLTEQGVDGCQIFGSAEEARDYAIELLNSIGVEDNSDVDEPEEANFSDVDGYEHGIFVTRFYTNNTEYMDRLFSETANDVNASQAEIEDAIENGEEIENDDEVITPIDSKTAVIEDKENGEFTKVTLVGETMSLDPISESEAEELTKNIVVESDEDDNDDEKDFSDVWSNDEATKFFSEYEELTDYMVRLFSGEADEEEIEDAIENGDQIENDDEIITPIDATTAVIEDKESGEFTKAVMDDDKLDIKPISEEEAEKLTSHLEVEDEDNEKDFSDVWSNDDITKFFSEDEELTDYMVRLFSDEASEEEIEDAIENGDQIENENEVITPIDATTAVIEDKESGEFTKAVMDDDKLDIEPISEEEAEELTNHLEVEDTNEDEDEDEKEYSLSGSDYVLDRYFAEALAPGMGPQGQPVFDEQGNQIGMMDVNGQVVPMEASAPVPGDPSQAPAPSVESIEDKAVAAVQQIQAAAAEAEATIMNAKAAPVQNQEADLQEAQFSNWYDEGDERYFSDVEGDTLVTWLNGTKYGRR